MTNQVTTLSQLFKWVAEVSLPRRRLFASGAPNPEGLPMAPFICLALNQAANRGLASHNLAEEARGIVMHRLGLDPEGLTHTYTTWLQQYHPDVDVEAAKWDGRIAWCLALADEFKEVQ